MTKSTEKTTPLLISVAEVARMLSISPRTVWRLLSTGKIIRPIRLGGAVRWRYDDVVRWIEDGCPPPDVAQ
jgi:excisionase family DNA binding protein